MVIIASLSYADAPAGGQHLQALQEEAMPLETSTAHLRHLCESFNPAHACINVIT